MLQTRYWVKTAKTVQGSIIENFEDNSLTERQYEKMKKAIRGIWLGKVNHKKCKECGHVK